MKFHVEDEFETTIERAWAIYFDKDFSQQLRERLNVDTFEELEFAETDEQIKIVYHLTVRRTLPDWVRKVIGDIKAGFTSHDLFDKKKKQMDVRMVSDIMPNKMKGHGVWTVRQSRPGFVIKQYTGEIRIDIPLVGGQMESKLAVALKGDFSIANSLLKEWVKRDQEALARGEPLPTLHPPQSFKSSQS